MVSEFVNAVGDVAGYINTTELSIAKSTTPNRLEQNRPV